MNRRSFIRLASGGMIGCLAGCIALPGGDDSGSAPEPTTAENMQTMTPEATTEATTETNTRTPTTTETTAETTTETTTQAPGIDTFSPVYEWKEFGDAQDKQLGTVAPELFIPFGFRYQATPIDGEVSIDEQVSVFNSRGSRVAAQQSTTRSVESSDQRSVYEHAVGVTADGWEPGEYQAELLLRDTNRGATSDPVTTTFEVARSLPGQDVSVTAVNSPRRIRAGESYQIDLTFRNRSTRDGGFVSTVSVRFPGEDWQPGGGQIGLLLSAEGSNDWVGPETTFRETGEVEFRIDDTGDTWKLTVE